MTKYRLHFNDIEEVFFNAENNTYKVDDCGTQDFHFSYQYKSIKGSYKEIVTNNFKIGYANGTLVNNTSIDFDFEGETIEMHFTLNGFSSTEIKNMKNDFSINTNEHNLFYGNNIKGNLEWNSKSISIFEINLKPNFIKKYLPNTHLFNSFKKIIQNKEIGFLNRFNYPITPQMHFIINQIIGCQWKNEYRLLFLESKILELLLLQIDQINGYDISTNKSKASKTVIEKMYYAKDLILDKINKPMSLNKLAREINTNEFTLKKEFKNVFGTTVFGYIKDVKMEEAKQILLNQNLTITEISDKMGYKNPQHFSTAFKRKFGLSPSVLRKKN